VEYGDTVYAVAVSIGTDVSPQMLKYVCEGYIGEAITRGLLSGQTTAAA